MYKLDIVIPVYNEGENIVPTLRALSEHVKTPARVLICYDMESDTTLPAVEAARSSFTIPVEFVRNPGRGPHAAVMAGFRASNAPYVLMMPADDDYNAGILDAMVQEAEKGADIVCASRFMRGGSMVGCPLLKATLVRLGSSVLHYVARVPAHDVSNGFRLFSRRVIEEIPVESTQGFTYSIELLVKAHRRGWNIAEVPARWIERTRGQSRFKVLSWLPAYLRWVRYAFATTYWHRYRAATLMVLATLVLCVVPVFQASLFAGAQWQEVPQVYMDEYIYYSHVTEAATGNLFFGNPYILEHRFSLPLVLFGSNILAALPLLAGLPLYLSLVFNFMLWSLVFVLLYYVLARNFSLARWYAAAVALFAYIQSYDQVYRISVRQEVFPFILLFWIALIRFIKKPESTKALLWLGVATGATFYIYGFLWQTAVATLVMLALYALCARHWLLLRRTLLALGVGVAAGAPALAYTLWVTTQPYFWESMLRFGLVDTRLPVAELIWSGGWVLVALGLAALLYWQVAPVPRRTFAPALIFVAATGAALFAMQGSNMVTSSLLEIGDHVRRFIIVWLPLATALLAYMLYSCRARMPRLFVRLAGAAVVLLALANVYFMYHHSHPFREPGKLQDVWQEQQRYGAPVRYLEQAEPEPVVVWGNADDFSTIHVPVLSKHYVLFVEPAQFMLMPTDEVRERYLVSRYFDDVTIESLKGDILLHAGRAYAFHLPKTIERGIKVCKLIKFRDQDSCGVAPTPEELLGEAYFAGLLERLETDIRPNIKEYLRKYQVSYVLKDTGKDTHYRPEELGGERVYKDDYFELYKLP